MNRDDERGMVVSTAPLRISLAGGGTDLPSYAARKGGVVVGTVTDLGVTVLRRRAGTGMRVYFENCRSTGDPQTIGNPFTREVGFPS
ncbi:MAG: hypothetical protein HY241_09535 [Actinobacteria bacterium]|nr:hypothetical protein [Actinomycetota bacterium]